MRLRRRTGCLFAPCRERWEPASWQHGGDGPEGNLSARLHTEVCVLSTHKPFSSQRLSLLQMHRAWGFPGLLGGSDEPVAVPGRARERFLQLSILPFPPSPLPLRPFLLSLSSPGLACNSYKSGAIWKRCWALWPKLLAGTGLAQDAPQPAQPFRRHGECTGLVCVFSCLSHPTGAGVAAAMEQPGASLGREPELGMAQGCWSSRAAGTRPLAAAAPPDPLALRLQNLI